MRRGRRLPENKLIHLVGSPSIGLAVGMVVDVTFMRGCCHDVSVVCCGRDASMETDDVVLMRMVAIDVQHPLDEDRTW